jgi:hypothetical protein
MTTQPGDPVPAARRRRVVAVIAAVLVAIGVLVVAGVRFGPALAGAAGPGSGSGRSATFAGHYVSRFEVSSFVPCGSGQAPGYAVGWWLASDPGSGFSDAYRRLIATPLPSSVAPARPDETVYVRFEGTVSGESADGYGHLNGYRRYVTVHRVLEMSVGAGGCPGAQGAPPS